jgi:DNA-binding FadR family transcriptional regulator
MARMPTLSPSGRDVAAGPRVGRIVRAPKTAELIAIDLRRQIVRGALKSGETLPPEVRLMEQYGVSRPTLREAFRILETETLITVRRGARGGAQVMTPDLSVAARYVGLLLQIQGTTIDDVYEARMVSEPYCARLLARRRTKQDLIDLRECIEELRAVVEAGITVAPDPGRWSSLSYRFHELVMERAGNNTLAVQGAVLADIVATHLHLTIAQTFTATESPGQFKRLIRSYEKLVRLVEERDADGAEEHWRRHLEQAAKYLFRNDTRSKPVVELFA